MHRPLLLGHRGARFTRSVPENTIASFDLALAHGCDGFEFDVRLTGDGQAVISHDPRAHGVEIARAAASELASLPSLEQILSRYRPAFLDIELKVPGLEKTLLKLLQGDPLDRGYVVSSFLPEVLAAIASLNPSIPLGLICEHQAQLAAWESLPVSFMIPHQRLVDHSLVQTLHAAGKKAFVWTVNEAADMRRLAGWQVDALISDNTKLLVETVGGWAG